MDWIVSASAEGVARSECFSDPEVLAREEKNLCLFPLC